jgi:hypothetical protein
MQGGSRIDHRAILDQQIVAWHAVPSVQPSRDAALKYQTRRSRE